MYREVSLTQNLPLIFSKLFRRNQSHVNEIKPDAEQPYPELQKLIHLFNSHKQIPEVLYLGDSVVERVSMHDSEQRTLGNMVIDSIKEDLSADYISHSAYHFGLFHGFVRVLQRLKYRPKILILPINLRSFSPQWDLSPLWQLEQEIQAVEQYLAKPRKRIPVIQPVVESPGLFDAFDATPSRYALSDFQYLGDFRNLIKTKPQTEEEKLFRLKQIFIFHYTHLLELSHPKVRLIEETLDLLNQMKIKTLLYVTPVNYCAGTKYVGEAFLEIVQRNVDVVSTAIQEHLNSNMVHFLDYSRLLTSDYFFHENDPTEHLNQEGRAQLAAKLSQATIGLNQASL